MNFRNATVLSAMLLATLTTGCIKSPTTVTPPGSTSGNTPYIDAAEAVLVGCEAATPLAGPIGTLIGDVCPPFVNGVLSIIESNGTAAALNNLYTALVNEINAVPGASVNKYIVSILNAAKGVISIFTSSTGNATGTPGVYYNVPAYHGANTSNPVTISYHPSDVQVLKIQATTTTPARPVLTQAEKDRIKALRKRVEKIKKKQASSAHSFGSALGEALFGGNR